MKTTTTIITIVMMLITIQLTSATTTYYWTNPSYNNQIIDTYPQKITIYATSTGTINNCNVTIGNSNNYVAINAQNTEIDITQRLAEGQYNVQITCADNTGVNSESKTFKVDNFATLNKQNEKNFQIQLWTILWIAMIILYFTMKKHSMRIFASVGMILISLYLIAIEGTQNLIIWLPIGFSIIIAILELTNKIDR